MVVTYYYGDPRQLRGYTAMLGNENSLLDYWFYPNKAYMDEVQKEKDKVEAENKKKEGEGKGKGKGKGGGGGGSGGGGGGQDGGKKDGENEGGKKDGNKQPDNKPKVIELKVRLCCEECARKVRKKIEKLEGVEKGVTCDIYENKVIVKGTAKPETVLKQAQKVKKDAQLLKKEPEKKKDDKKKDDKKKDDKKDDDDEKNDD